MVDTDHSGEIDRQEALEHWKKKGTFPKLNANAFFDTVDVNHDGTITYAEFVGFWEHVAGGGVDEEEIMMELENIENGESWAGFKDLMPEAKQHNK